MTRPDMPHYPQPPVQAYPPQGYQQPVRLAPKKRRLWPWVLIGIVVLMFAGCVGLVSTVAGNGNGGSSGPAAGGQKAQAAGIGTPVRDGKFEFIVTKVDPGVAKVGNELIGKTAQGQFILVHVTVKNIGDVAQHFDGSNQKLIDAQGRQFSADGAAAFYLDESDSFLNQVNPGNSVNGIVVFDAPKDVQPTKIELHDSPFSGGVTVTLG